MLAYFFNKSNNNDAVVLSLQDPSDILPINKEKNVLHLSCTTSGAQFFYIQPFLLH